jgi:two-component system response regulator YesN
MLRVMIVDDEPVIRFGIKASIDWEKEGFQVIGDFANGAEAMEKMNTEPVDILITDIKMPVMDGLVLTQNALKLNPRTKVIMVSSYNDFEYVREGLRLGVVDYILKPTLEPEDLLATVIKCKDMITEELRLQNKLQIASKGVLTNERKKYEQELKRLLIHKKETMSNGSYPDWLNRPFTAVYAVFNRIRLLEEAYGFLHKSIVLDLFIDTLHLKIPQSIAISTEESEIFFLMPGSENPREAFSTLQNELNRQIGANVSFGYVEGTGRQAVELCFGQSKEACQRSFFEGEGIFQYKEHTSDDGDGCNLPSLMQAFPNPNDEKIGEAVKRWKADWAHGGISPTRLKEEACRVLSILFKHSIDPFVLVESFERMFKSGTLEELCVSLKDQIVELRKHTPEVDLITSNNPVDKALDYIRSNYLEPMTLQEVADVVHVSKNYFSILFKKVTGQNFIDFVIHLRIQRAKELLVGTDLKVYEVAEHSGFNDVKYFSKLFKKISMFSPNDYREQQRLTQNNPEKGESVQ